MPTIQQTLFIKISCDKTKNWLGDKSLSKYQGTSVAFAFIYLEAVMDLIYLYDVTAWSGKLGFGVGLNLICNAAIQVMWLGLSWPNISTYAMHHWCWHRLSLRLPFSTGCSEYFELKNIVLYFCVIAGIICLEHWKAVTKGRSQINIVIWQPK